MKKTKTPKKSGYKNKDNFIIKKSKVSKTIKGLKDYKLSKDGGMLKRTTNYQCKDTSNRSKTALRAFEVFTWLVIYLGVAYFIVRTLLSIFYNI